MSARLTYRLLFATRHAWRQLAENDSAAAEARLQTADDADGAPARSLAPALHPELPSPAWQGALLGGGSALIAGALAALLPQATFAGVVRVILAAVSGCLGATSLAIWLAPRILQRPGLGAARLTRYASVVSLPLAAAGAVPLLPTSVSFIAIAALCALAYRSGSLGADVFLGLAGVERTRAAAWTSLVSTLPALLAVPLCAAR